MGLDSYIFAIPKEEGDPNENETYERTEVAYWRKHWDIHDYFVINLDERISSLQDDEMTDNCTYVPVYIEDLEYYRDMIKEDLLSKAIGQPVSTFDWIDESYLQDFNKLIEYAKNNTDMQLYYYAWY